jgi:hypothetical protein
MKKIIAFLLVIALVKNVDGQECNSPDGGIWLYINGTEKGWTDDAVNHLSVYDTTLCHGDVGILSVVYGGCGPGTTTWSNGIVGDTLTVTSSGIYVASVVCGLGVTSDTFHITFRPLNAPIANAGLSQILIACGTDTLGGNPAASSGTPPYYYSWSPWGNLPAYANPLVQNIYSTTTYTLVVSDSNGCQSVPSSVTVTPLLTAPVFTTPPTVSKVGCEVSCEIIANCTYQWYHNGLPISGATTPTYSEDSSGDWYAVITSTIYPLCNKSSNLLYVNPYQNQQICIVTLDSTNTYNMVVWNNTPGENIDKYRIYKQSDSTSQFILLGEEPATQFSTYTDITSTPSQTSASYAISIVDSCNNESSLSATHTTILLSSNLGINHTVNLNWNAYVGFTYSDFEIWRSANGGPMTLLSTVANNTFAYIDNSPPIQAYYQIQITNPNGCNPSRSAFDYSTVRSNIVNNSGSTNSIENLSVAELSMNVYPNPSNGTVYVKIAAQRSQVAELQVKDVLGRLVREESIEIKPDDNNINFTRPITGTYCIEILNSSNEIVGKKVFIIQ